MTRGLNRALLLLPLLPLLSCAPSAVQTLSVTSQQPSFALQEYGTPARSAPHDAVPDRSGWVWYTGQGDGTLGRLDPASGEVMVVPIAPGSAPHGVIIGPDDGIDLSSRQPDITGNDRTGGQVEIGFNKLTSDGENIYSKREGDADFIFLARDTQTPYLDNRPLKVPGKPEIREYKAMFVVGDQEIDLFRDEVVVKCAP